MKIGYMTNAFGPQVGTLGGVMSIKDSKFLSLLDEAEVIKQITDTGFSYIEMFDGNLDKYKDDLNELKEILKDNEASLLGVYVTANFIYEDAFEDELWHIVETAKLAKEMGARHIVLGGGAIRSTANTEDDFKIMAKNLDRATAEIEKFDLIASFHPHLGCMIESPEDINKLFSYTNINFCPDIAHLAAGGSDPLEMVEKYMDRIKYVHLKDYIEGEFVPLGKGNQPLVEIIELLNSNGYKGDWLVEIDGYKGEPLEACEISFEFTEKHLAKEGR